MELKFIPKEGILIDGKKILLGESQKKIIDILNKPEKINNRKTCKRFFYNEHTLALDFKPNDMLEGIEMFPDDCILLNFNNINLLDKDCISTLNSLKKLGYKTEKTDDKYVHIFKDLQLCIYCPDNELESVGIFEKGYYSFMGIE